MLIGELVKLSGLSKDGIRHYEKLGIIRSYPRQAGSRIYKEFSAGSLKRIEQAKQAQQLGLSLKEIGPILDIYENEGFTESDTVAFLSERLRLIQTRISELREVETFIQNKLTNYTSINEKAQRADHQVKDEITNPL